MDRDQPQRRHRAVYLAPTASQVQPRLRPIPVLYDSGKECEDGNDADQSSSSCSCSNESSSLSPLSIEEDTPYSFPSNMPFPPPPPIYGSHSQFYPQNRLVLPPRRRGEASAYPFPPSQSQSQYSRYHNRLNHWMNRCAEHCRTLYFALVDVAILAAVCCMSCFFYDVEVKVVRTEERDDDSYDRLPNIGSRIIIRSGAEGTDAAFSGASDPLLAPSSPSLEFGSMDSNFMLHHPSRHQSHEHQRQNHHMHQGGFRYAGRDLC